MKKIILLPMMALCFTVVAQKNKADNNKPYGANTNVEYKEVAETSHVSRATAEVNREGGLYIFSDSSPVAPYEVLGSIKGPGVTMGSTQYDAVKKKLIARVKDKYPDADGIILFLFDGGRDRADAIKFK